MKLFNHRFRKFIPLIFYGYVFLFVVWLICWILLFRLLVSIHIGLMLLFGIGGEFIILFLMTSLQDTIQKRCFPSEDQLINEFSFKINAFIRGIETNLSIQFSLLTFILFFYLFGLWCYDVWLTFY